MRGSPALLSCWFSREPAGVTIGNILTDSQTQCLHGLLVTNCVLLSVAASLRLTHGVLLGSGSWSSACIARALLDIDCVLLLTVAAGPEVQGWHRACGGIQGAGFS
jgi:hypothetical protein